MKEIVAGIDGVVVDIYHQSNNSDPQSDAREHQEIHAMVHYLFSNSESFQMNKMPYTGDALRGQELVESLGCLACHQKDNKPSMRYLTLTTTNALADSVNAYHLGKLRAEEYQFQAIVTGQFPPMSYPTSYHLSLKKRARCRFNMQKNSD